MDNLRGFLGIRKMDKVPNTWIRKLYRMTKVLKCFLVEKMENNRTAKVVLCRGSVLVV